MGTKNEVAKLFERHFGFLLETQSINMVVGL